MRSICLTLFVLAGTASIARLDAQTGAAAPTSARAAARQKPARPLTSFELLLKLYHGTLAAAAAAVKVRGVDFQVTPAIEAGLIEAGADKSMLALVALRRQEIERPAAVAPSIRMDPAAQARKLLRKQEAVYPPAAGQARGAVTIEVVVGQDGRVKNTRVLTGAAPFVAAALQSVQSYVYKPTILDDQAVEVTTTVTIDFEPKN